VPLVGIISMDTATFDVTDAPQAIEGGFLELIGPRNPVDALAAQAGTIGCEILTSLGGRYARAYADAPQIGRLTSGPVPRQSRSTAGSSPRVSSR
jgi:hypothetical protein